MTLFTITARVVLIVNMGAVTSVSLESREKLSIALSTHAVLNDSRLPFPQNLDYNRLYCFDSTSPSSLFQATSVTAGACVVDSDCVYPSSSGPYCIGGECHECRSPADCPASLTSSASSPLGSVTTISCSSDTSFVCSECAVDSDCEPNSICRTVHSPIGPNRKRCITGCPNVPAGVAMKSMQTCDWYCQGYETIGPDGSCAPCPICSDGQMLIPTDNFLLGQPEFFFPTCAFSTDPKCVTCPGADNECAVQLTPSQDWSAFADQVGTLPQQIPCNVFKCKPDWWLDKSVGQCRKCNYRSCPQGQQLSGCGGNTPGTCTACPALVDPDTPFVDPRSLAVSILAPADACKPACGSGTYLFKQTPTYPWQCSPCAGTETCPPGYMFAGCGPGESAGRCIGCGTQPMPGTYWSAPGCVTAACDPTSCAPGTTLAGCGGSSPGHCVTCPNDLPANAIGFTKIFDQVTMTTDTCAVTCTDGFFLTRTTNSGDSTGVGYTCSKCAVCPLGKMMEGCGGNSPGQCVDCPPPRIGYFFDQSAAKPDECSVLKCQSDSSCPLGERFVGCGDNGGLSPGKCESCGTLPVGAASWAGASCDIECKPMYFTEKKSDATTSCVSCDALARQCNVGQHLVGCSATSPGACVACSSIPVNTYWTSPSLNCTTAACNPSSCPSGQVLRDCGQSSAGTCVACDGPLPQNSQAWTAVQDSGECQPVCSEGYFFSAGSKKCEVCNIGECAIGMVLNGCGGASPGTCGACNAPQDGYCFTSPGQTVGDPKSCITALCLPNQI